MTAPPPRDREVACTGKEQLSHDQARKIERRWTNRGTGRNAYRCQFCGFWHIGHSSRSPGRHK